MVKTLYLLRHGQTDYNKHRLFYGSTDVSLNDEGVVQAKQMFHFFEHKLVEKIYVSQLQRTQETAQYVFPKAEFIPLAALNEKGFGAWEGLDANAIQAAYPVEWEQWLMAPLSYVPPLAEPFEQFEARVCSGLDRVLSQLVSSSVIVAHLGVLRLIYQQLIDTTAAFWEIDFPQGKVTTLLCHDGKWQINFGGSDGANR